MSLRKKYSEILGVPEYPSEAELKKSYRALSKKYHPDLNDDTVAGRKFMAVNEAYAYLQERLHELPPPLIADADTVTLAPEPEPQRPQTPPPPQPRAQVQKKSFNGSGLVLAFCFLIVLGVSSRHFGSDPAKKDPQAERTSAVAPADAPEWTNRLWMHECSVVDGNASVAESMRFNKSGDTLTYQIRSNWYFDKSCRRLVRIDDIEQSIKITPNRNDWVVVGRVLKETQKVVDQAVLDQYIKNRACGVANWTLYTKINMAKTSCSKDPGDVAEVSVSGDTLTWTFASGGSQRKSGKLTAVSEIELERLMGPPDL